MLAPFVFIFMSQVSVLILLYIADRGLKIVSKNRIKQVEMISLRKSHRNFLVRYRRKEGIITKFAFKCMIAYYIINATGFIAIFIQYVLGDNSFKPFWKTKNDFSTGTAACSKRSRRRTTGRSQIQSTRTTKTVTRSAKRRRS